MIKVILIIFIIISSPLFSQNSNFLLKKQIKISELHKIEKEISRFIGRIDYTPYGGPEIKTYKNIYNLDLTKPYIYMRKNKFISNLPLTTTYFYAKFDSLVRVCIYEWFTTANFRIPDINNEYNKIREYIIDTFGSCITIESKKVNKESKNFISNKCLWNVNNKIIELSIIDETLVKKYSSPTRIRLSIVWQDKRKDKLRYFRLKVFKSYEVDEKPLDMDYINISVPKDVYVKYKDILKIATILISNNGKVEDINFYKEHSYDKILKKEIELLKFKPAKKDKINVRCEIIVEVKLKTP